MTEDKTPRRALTAITVDEEIQQRVIHIDDAVVSDYAERIEAGDTFPPVVVFQGDDGQLILADGFHRYHAYKKAGKGQVRSPDGCMLHP
jgi:uncharacterized ParB-like nuclease family protein